MGLSGSRVPTVQLPAFVRIDSDQAVSVERSTERTFPDQGHNHTTVNAPSAIARKELYLRSSSGLIQDQLVNWWFVEKAV
jgi:hypothetical protein